MEIASLIPNVFYDLIARLIPGFVIMATMYVAYAGPGKTAANLDSFLRTNQMSGASMLVVVLLISVSSYVLAMLLSGVAHWVNLKDRLDRSGGSTASTEADSGRTGAERAAPSTEPRAREDIARQVETRPDIAQMYDLVSYVAPRIGARLTKVRSECRCCDMLIVGWGLLCIANPLLLFWHSSLLRALGTECALVLLIVAAIQQRRRLYGHFHRGLRNFHEFVTSSREPRSVG